MRALYLPDLQKALIKNEVTINDIHHFVNVIKIKEKEEVLLLDGQGTKAIALVHEISKKRVKFIIQSQTQSVPEFNLSLAQCLVKKEAMEDILRMSAEVGLSQVFPLQSQHSWHLFIPNQRINSIMGSALEQSNNANLPRIHEPQKLQDFDFKIFDRVLYFSSNPIFLKQKAIETLQKSQKILLLIGPEGGLTNQEEEVFLTQKNFTFVHLPTPILRAPTAVLVATGYTLSKL